MRVETSNKQDYITKFIKGTISLGKSPNIFLVSDSAFSEFSLNSLAKFVGLGDINYTLPYLLSDAINSEEDVSNIVLVDSLDKHLQALHDKDLNKYKSLMFTLTNHLEILENKDFLMLSVVEKA